VAGQGQLLLNIISLLLAKFLASENNQKICLLSVIFIKNAKFEAKNLHLRKI